MHETSPKSENTFFYKQVLELNSATINGLGQPKL
jgi:hypothetical protein